MHDYVYCEVVLGVYYKIYACRLCYPLTVLFIAWDMKNCSESNFPFHLRVQDLQGRQPVLCLTAFLEWYFGTRDVFSCHFIVVLTALIVVITTVTSVLPHAIKYVLKFSFQWCKCHFSMPLRCKHLQSLQSYMFTWKSSLVDTNTHISNIIITGSTFHTIKKMTNAGRTLSDTLWLSAIYFKKVKKHGTEVAISGLLTRNIWVSRTPW
jgi:hypothetical protein